MNGVQWTVQLLDSTNLERKVQTFKPKDYMVIDETSCVLLRSFSYIILTFPVFCRQEEVHSFPPRAGEIDTPSFSPDIYDEHFFIIIGFNFIYSQ